MVLRTTSGHSPRRDSAGWSPGGPSLRKACLSGSPRRRVVYPQVPRALRLILEPVRREPQWEGRWTPLCAPLLPSSFIVVGQDQDGKGGPGNLHV